MRKTYPTEGKILQFLLIMSCTISKFPYTCNFPLGIMICIIGSIDISNIHNESNNNNDSIAKYYQNKDNVNLSLTNETKFTSHYFWLRVHQLLTSSLKIMIQSIGLFKYNKMILYQKNHALTINILN